MFVYDKDIPDAVLSAIKSALEPWEWVVPVWCERVFIGWSDESNENSATTKVEYPYRWARITSSP